MDQQEEHHSQKSLHHSTPSNIHDTAIRALLAGWQTPNDQAL